MTRAAFSGSAPNSSDIVGQPRHRPQHHEMEEGDGERRDERRSISEIVRHSRQAKTCSGFASGASSIVTSIASPPIGAAPSTVMTRSSPAK